MRQPDTGPTWAKNPPDQVAEAQALSNQLRLLTPTELSILGSRAPVYGTDLNMLILKEQLHRALHGWAPPTENRTETQNTVPPTPPPVTLPQNEVSGRAAVDEAILNWRR